MGWLVGRFFACGFRLRFFRLSAFALFFGFLAGLFIAADHPASAETGIKPTDKCEISSDQRRINVLLLLDASRSLSRTDPGISRQGGLEAAVVNLANLARSNPEVDISIAVDTFSTGYSRRHGWQDAQNAQRALSGRYNGITALGDGITGSFTDYREAMRGVADRFREAPTSGCNLLMWFTDGEHATEGTSSDVSEREWEQLRMLCASEEMADLKERNVYSVGVLLSSIDSPVNSGPLEQIFGMGTSVCRYALDGEIRADVETSSLRDALDELINEVVYEVEAELETEDDLPREERGLPDEDAYESCSGGDGTAASPCVYSFSLDSEKESFRVFVDMTFLGSGISNPGAVKIRVRSPLGIVSEPVVSAAQQAANAQQDDAQVAQYQPVRPFWFLSQRPYDSRWEIIGHQAAEQIADEGDWEWDGEWSLLFWGDTPEAQADAGRVAAAFRAITVDAPSASMNLNEGKLIGFIENFPNDYSSVELNLEPRDANDEPVYPTRPNLKCESADCNPVPVSGDNHRFEVLGLFDEVVWWDNEEAGGDGLRLESALERGQVSVGVVLDQEFLYGGERGYGTDGESGQPLSWSNDIGRHVLEDLDAFLDGKDAWEELRDWVPSGEPPALPFDLRLLPPPYDVAGDKVVFRLEVSPGYFPGVVSLEGVSIRTAATGATQPDYDEDWTCEVPGTAGRGDVEPTTCRAVRIDLGLSEDSEVTAQLDFQIAPVADFERVARSDELTVPSEQEWNELWSAIQQAAVPRRESLESAPFQVDLPTPGDKLGEFLPILLSLMALAAALRFFVAWRLRPWAKLDSPEYVVKPLGDAPRYHSSTEEVEESICMDLTRRTVKGQIGDVLVFSSWMPLLAGRPPRLGAKSSRGGCIGPRDYYTTGKGERIGIIGPDLRDGWVVEIVGQQYNLVVWDLGADETDRLNRIAEVEDSAAEQVRAMRSETQADNTREKGFTSTSESDEASAVPADPFGDSASDPLGDQVATRSSRTATSSRATKGNHTMLRPVIFIGCGGSGEKAVRYVREAVRA